MTHAKLIQKLNQVEVVEFHQSWYKLRKISTSKGSWYIMEHFHMKMTCKIIDITTKKIEETSWIKIQFSLQVKRMWGSLFYSRAKCFVRISRSSIDRIKSKYA